MSHMLLSVFELEAFELFLRVEGEFQHGGRAAVDGARAEALDAGVLAEIAGDEAGFEVDAQGLGRVGPEGEAVIEVVLLDGPPVFGVAQG